MDKLRRDILGTSKKQDQIEPEPRDSSTYFEIFKLTKKFSGHLRNDRAIVTSRNLGITLDNGSSCWLHAWKEVAEIF